MFIKLGHTALGRMALGRMALGRMALGRNFPGRGRFGTLLSHPALLLATGNRGLSHDFGGIGFEFYSTVVKPYFEKLREKEEEAGGSGWDARKKKSEFLPVQCRSSRACQ